jgi:hypothetical protein
MYYVPDLVLSARDTMAQRQRGSLQGSYKVHLGLGLGLGFLFFLRSCDTLAYIVAFT